jgi:hypothetical protein
VIAVPAGCSGGPASSEVCRDPGHVVCPRIRAAGRIRAGRAPPG